MDLYSESIISFDLFFEPSLNHSQFPICLIRRLATLLVYLEITLYHYSEILFTFVHLEKSATQCQIRLFESKVYHRTLVDIECHSPILRPLEQYPQIPSQTIQYPLPPLIPLRISALYHQQIWGFYLPISHLDHHINKNNKTVPAPKPTPVKPHSQPSPFQTPHHWQQPCLLSVNQSYLSGGLPKTCLQHPQAPARWKTDARKLDSDARKRPQDWKREKN